jgi:hypothetical protein
VARYVIPFRPNGKTRLGDPRLAVCMADDVIAPPRASRMTP